MQVAEAVYVDTSTLIKWYISEPYSDEVEAFLTGDMQPVLSSLALLEWDCTMRRRERAGNFDEHYRLLAEREFATQLAEGFFRQTEINRQVFELARELIRQVEPIPLRAMDALHLASASSLGISRLATSDRILADASRKLGLITYYFND